MAEATPAFPPCTAARRMVVLRTITTTGCPTEKHADALKLAAQTLAELAGRSQAQVATIATFDAAVDAIAALITDSSNITFASSLPAKMRRVVEECALFYTPRERPHTANLPATNNLLLTRLMSAMQGINTSLWATPSCGGAVNTRGRHGMHTSTKSSNNGSGSWYSVAQRVCG
jgi:hypothetical protein